MSYVAYVPPQQSGIFGSIASALAGLAAGIVSALQQGIGSLLHALVLSVLQAVTSILGAVPVWIMSQFADAGYTRVLLNNPWAHGLVLLAQGVAVSVLGLRLAWEAFHQHVLREQGQTTDLMGLVRNAGIAAFSIFAFPLLSVRLILFGNDLASAVVGVLGSQVGALGTGMARVLGSALAMGTIAAAGMGPLAFIVLGAMFAVIGFIAVILLVLIFLQAMIRTVEAFVAGVIGPILAVGWMSDGGGTAATWWRSLIVLCMSQAVQLMLLYLSTAISLAPGLPIYLRPFLFLATLWVTFRTPHMLQEYAYHSGLGSGASAAGNAAVSIAARMLFL